MRFEELEEYRLKSITEIRKTVLEILDLNRDEETIRKALDVFVTCVGSHVMEISGCDIGVTQEKPTLSGITVKGE
jgi:hypothetical protein